MPIKLYTLILSVVAIFQIACDSATDRQWAQTVPGKYEGACPHFREIVELRPDGKFRHQVFIDAKPFVDELGAWSFNVESGFVRLGPITSFYDPKSDKMTLKGMLIDQGAFSVIRFGSAAERITQSINHELYLHKVLGN